MKYAVLGTGMVGHTLATKLASLGHDVRMGARSADNEMAIAWAKANGTQAGHGTFVDVASWADRVIFAVNGANMVDVADAVTEAAVTDKTDIDVTNPLDMTKLHPFHIHGCSFRILTENGAEPPAYAQGWKDMVHVEEGWSEVLVQFNYDGPCGYALHVPLPHLGTRGLRDDGAVHGELNPLAAQSAQCISWKELGCNIAASPEPT